MTIFELIQAIKDIPVSGYEDNSTPLLEELVEYCPLPDPYSDDEPSEAAIAVVTLLHWQAVEREAYNVRMRQEMEAAKGEPDTAAKYIERTTRKIEELSKAVEFYKRRPEMFRPLEG